MFFDSFLYVAFFSVMFLYYYFSRDSRQRQYVFLIASLIFYGFFKLIYVWIMLFVILVSFYAAQQLARDPKDRWLASVKWPIAIIIFPLLLYKYFDFLSLSLTEAIGFAGYNFDPVLLHLVLPAGISFFTLHAVGYVLDVHFGRMKAEPSLLKYALFISFFPQLVAGPIARAGQLLPQMTLERNFSPDWAVSGLRLILLGLGFKLFGADVISARIDPVFNNPGNYSGWDHARALLMFTWQVYADFAGYSYVALGSARVFGVELMVNFRQPLIQDSVPNFWRNWHISLTTWLQDYVFKFMQFSLRDYGNFGLWLSVMLTFLLVGFWHGAAWKFFFLGLVHGILVNFSNQTLPQRNKFWRRSGLDPRLVFAYRSVLTYCVVSMTLVFFRANNVTDSFEIINRVATGAKGSSELVLGSAALWVVVALFTHDILARMDVSYENLPAVVRWAGYVTLGSAVLVAMFAGIQTTKPFIYFQF